MEIIQYNDLVLLEQQQKHLAHHAELHKKWHAIYYTEVHQLLIQNHTHVIILPKMLLLELE